MNPKTIVRAWQHTKFPDGSVILCANGKHYGFSCHKPGDFRNGCVGDSASSFEEYGHNYVERMGEEIPVPKQQCHVDDVYDSLTEGQRQHMANKLHKHGYVAAKAKPQKTEVVKRLDRMTKAEQRECLGWVSAKEILAIYDKFWPSLMPIAIREWLKDNTLA